MELFRVSFSAGTKGSLSSSSALDLVTIKWDIWSFRVCSDCTAAKKRERRKAESQQVTFKEKLASNCKGESKSVHVRHDPGSIIRPKSLLHMLPANTYLLNTCQVAEPLWGAWGHNCEQDRHDACPHGAPSPAGEAGERSKVASTSVKGVLWWVCFWSTEMNRAPGGSPGRDLHLW